MDRLKVAIDDLRYGMYVAELDRPWTETPFVFQGFILRTPRQTETLRNYCAFVYVDVDRSDAALQAEIAARGHPPPGAPAARERSPLEAEVPRARDAFVRGRALIEESLRTLRSRAVIDAPRVREAATLIAESVARNPDALLLITRMQQIGGDLARRALDTSVYMAVFGRFLQRTAAEIEVLSLAGLLQDAGKIRLPEALLNKQGPLTPRERDVARGHVGLTVAMLRATAGLPAGVAELAALHHERHDGSGYPGGLRGSEIGLDGAIAAIVDVFTAVTSPRPYAPALAPASALGLLHKERGTSFHAGLVEQFVQCVGVFPVGSTVEMNSREIGIVVSQHPVLKLKPRVMVLYDSQGRPIRPHKLLDLSREPQAAPGEPYHIRRTLEHGRVRIDPRELFL